MHFILNKLSALDRWRGATHCRAFVLGALVTHAHMREQDCSLKLVGPPVNLTRTDFAPHLKQRS
jgi:hypothetical protein